MDCISINKFLSNSLYRSKILFSVIIGSEKIKKKYDLDMIIKSIPKPIYFYNGPYHNKSCIYSEDKYIDELLPYITKRLKKHKDLKKFNDIPLRDYINSKWKKLKEFVYVNTITTVVRFDNLNNKVSMDTLLELKKNIQPELSIDNKNLSKLKKEYDEMK